MLCRNLVIIATIFIATVAPLGGLAATSSADGPPTVSEILRLHVQTDKSSYKLRAPIYVLITVTNATNDPVRIKAGPPWGLCSLIISSDQGDLSPTRGGLGWRWSMLDTAVYPPHTGHFASFFDYQNDKYVQWTNINTWGYELSAAGTYRIAIASRMEGFLMAGPSKGEWFTTPESDRSNTVTISVKN